MPVPTYGAGRAEKTGLPTGQADAVLAAQAFHWFEADAALREFHRLLKPGGWTVLLQRTRFGRYVYAIGGNPEAARRAGVSLAGVRIGAFALCSATAGLGGILLGSFFYGQYSTNTADPGQLVLYAVAAAVIGGTSLFGGRGKPLHGMLGGLLIGAIAYGVSLLQLGTLSTPLQYILPGGVLVAAVLVDVVSRRSASTGRVARA